MYGRTGPTLDRAITLQIQGDIGIAVPHRVGGWIASQILPRTATGTRVAVWSSPGPAWIGAVRSVAEGEVDLALVTPANTGAMAFGGQGPFAAAGVPELRALATLPQFDRLIVAVRKDLGVGSFAELREQKPALRIATPSDEALSPVAWYARRLLEAEGVPEELLASWGGSLVEPPGPPGTFFKNYPGMYPNLVAGGSADAVIHEAMMLDEWHQVAEDPGLTFLPVEPEALTKLQDAHGLGAAEVPAGYYPGQPDAFTTVDFADFLVVCRADMPEDLAHLITWSMGETRLALESQYRHEAPEKSPLTYPIQLDAMRTTPIPLHPGAARYYDGL